MLLFYIIFLIFSIILMVVIYFIINSYFQKSANTDTNIDTNFLVNDWTDEHKSIIKNFLLENEQNKNIIDCMINNIIIFYSFETCNKIIKEIYNYKKNSDDANISLSKETTEFISNLIDIEKKCSK